MLLNVEQQHLITEFDSMYSLFLLLQYFWLSLQAIESPKCLQLS